MIKPPGCQRCLARPQLVFLVGIRNLDGQEEIAARVAPRQTIVPFRGSKVVLTLLLSDRRKPELNLIRAEQALAAVKIELVLGLADDHAVRRRDLVRASRRREAHREQ